jgi:hypothetical protein
VLLHLLLGWLTWIGGHLDMLGLLVELILDLDLLIVADLVAGGAQQPVTVPALSRGAASFAQHAGSYRFRAMGRGYAAYALVPGRVKLDILS